MSSYSKEDQVPTTTTSSRSEGEGEQEKHLSHQEQEKGLPSQEQEKDLNLKELGKDSEIWFPEGGWQAWLVVFGAWTSTFFSFGYINSFGVFQAYYSNNFLSDHSLSDIAWIGSLQYGLVFGTGIFTGQLFERGHFDLLFPIAGFSLVVLQMLLSLCTEYYQFLLCQGIALGFTLGVRILLDFLLFNAQLV